MLQVVLGFGSNACLHHSKKSYTCTSVPRVMMSKYGSAVYGWDLFWKRSDLSHPEAFETFGWTRGSCVCVCVYVCECSFLYGYYIPAGFLPVRLAVPPGCGALPPPLSSNVAG